MQIEGLNSKMALVTFFKSISQFKKTLGNLNILASVYKAMFTNVFQTFLWKYNTLLALKLESFLAGKSLGMCTRKNV